jgi:hypothetical protein
MLAPLLQLQYCISCSICDINVIGDIISAAYVVEVIVTIV